MIYLSSQSYLVVEEPLDDVVSTWRMALFQHVK